MLCIEFHMINGSLWCLNIPQTNVSNHLIVAASGWWGSMVGGAWNPRWVFRMRCLAYCCLLIYWFDSNWHLHILILVCPVAPKLKLEQPALSRTWAGYLNQPMSPMDRRKMKEKAVAEDRQLVKMSLNQDTGRKYVTFAESLNCAKQLIRFVYLFVCLLACFNIIPRPIAVHQNVFKK